MARLVGVLTALVLVASMALVALAALPPGGTFVDDDLSPHEGNIEALVASGVINGCGIDPARYCPLMAVTRAETAALLLRATGALDELASYQGLFSDVPEDAWFAAAVDDVGYYLCLFGQDVRDNDARALFGQGQGLRSAQADGCAGDDGHFAFESPDCCPPIPR